MTKFLLHLILLGFCLISSCSTSKVQQSGWQLVVDKQNFPEGITWDYNNTLYSSNCYGNWITKIQNGVVDTFLLASDSTFQKTNGLFAINENTIIAADYGNGKILKFSSNGITEILVDGYLGNPLNRPNDLTFDKNGNLFFTDPKNYGIDKLDGRIFYYNIETAEIRLLKDSLAFPNGIAFSPIDDKLYICESAKSRIIRFDSDAYDKLTNMEVFVELPGGDPDGINFDERGNLYVAHFGGGAVIVISVNGDILRKINTPGKKPSNVEFGDEDLKTLYITEDETNSIYK
ncbi:MAG: SMP-30/gluconolactonase/LRE family protein, partial [Ignavibacteriae bacterium]|nr:SMP-30/gluconolactonase/LRE family protein [Ignavibacteriota bacterium]